MLIRSILACGVAAMLLAGCATTSPDAGGDDLFSGGRVSAAETTRRAKAAARHPLGSRENPVRVNMPAGQRNYLTRLRCSDGAAPAFVRVGNFGAGIYGSIIDGYEVTCLGGQPARSLIFMDMYHPDHVETAAPPGFTLAR
ncbi:MAG: hypothetical protein ACK4RV_11540 [Caulobacter sp.]|jgi:hypothetical protein